MTRRPPILTAPPSRGTGGLQIPTCTSASCTDQRERLHAVNLRLAVELARAQHAVRLHQHTTRHALHALAQHDPAAARAIHARHQHDQEHQLTTRQALTAIKATRKASP